MNIILGLIVIAVAVGLAITCYGMFRDDSGPWMGLGLGIIVVTVIVALGALGLAAIFNVDMGPRLVEGACYRAVGQTTVMPITTGKVTTVVPMHDVNLVEIRCP